VKLLIALVYIYACVCVSGCSRTDLPQLEDRVLAEDFTRQHDASYMRPSTTIVVCQPEQVWFSNWRRRATRVPNLHLQLVQVECYPEAVLKGRLPSKKISFYYYRLDVQDQSRPPVTFLPKFKANVGERYIFFLVNDGGNLRATGDVFDYMMQVYTGPIQTDLSLTQSLDNNLLRVISEPRRGYSVATICSNLSSIAIEAFNIAPDAELNRVFGNLVSSDARLKLCAEEYLKHHK
jgi:hypothetical protein